MARLVCNNCGYRFVSKANYNPKNCPYCNKESVEEERDAENLIEEVEKLLN